MELKNRYKTIKNSTSIIVYVPELVSIPETLFSGDITGDTKDWKNECYDLFFKPKKVITKPNKDKEN
ncbi:hypothetical protein [Flavobacterium ovatum]|uniref:hypothetical protein n=1 Tax=Flavobacterium ovatum TaxID=1928857 RepID=UPI00344D031C